MVITIPDMIALAGVILLALWGLLKIVFRKTRLRESHWFLFSLVTLTIGLVLFHLTRSLVAGAVVGAVLGFLVVAFVIYENRKRLADGLDSHAHAHKYHLLDRSGSDAANSSSWSKGPPGPHM